MTKSVDHSYSKDDWCSYCGRWKNIHFHFPWTVQSNECDWFGKPSFSLIKRKNEKH